MPRTNGLNRFCSILVTVVVMLIASPTRALDNPDVPDFVAEFEARAKPYEVKISEHAGITDVVTRNYADYEKFLDTELNRSYSALTGKLSSSGRQQLVQSQKKWLAFRDAEFAFIDANWSLQRFGTSSHLSRGAYRAELVRERTRTLLNYLKNYPG